MKTPVQVAQEISALLPVKPKVTLLGGEAHRAQQIEYGTFHAAALGAWQYAAHQALNVASSASPKEWVVDQDNHAFIDGVKSISDLESMCESGYPWTGRRVDQV